MPRAEDRPLMRPTRLVVHHDHHGVQMHLDEIIVSAERAVVWVQDARFLFQRQDCVDERGFLGGGKGRLIFSHCRFSLGMKDILPDVEIRMPVCPSCRERHGDSKLTCPMHGAYDLSGSSVEYVSRVPPMICTHVLMKG